MITNKNISVKTSSTRIRVKPLNFHLIQFHYFIISKTCLLHSVHSKYNYMATYHSSHITSKLNIFYGYKFVHLNTDIQAMKCN